MTLPLFVLSNNKIIGRADAEDKWLKESYPETTSESENDFVEKDDDEDSDYETVDPAVSHCSSKEFECVSDQKCIPIEKYCDYTTDCDDGSDESSCTTTASPVDSEADARSETNDVDGSGVVTEGDGVLLAGCLEFKILGMAVLLPTFFARESL